MHKVCPPLAAGAGALVGAIRNPRYPVVELANGLLCQPVRVGQEFTSFSSKFLPTDFGPPAARRPASGVPVAASVGPEGPPGARARFGRVENGAVFAAWRRQTWI